MMMLSYRELNDPIEIADYYNDYFTRLGPNLASKLPKNNVDPMFYVNTTSITSISL